MSQVIRISNELYERLKGYARGFDSPANVIERILNEYEGPSPELSESPEKKLQSIDLDVSFSGLTEAQFKDELLRKKQAYVMLEYTDGTVEYKIWNANKFTVRSNLLNNLRSGFLRNWREKGIQRASLSFHQPKPI